MASSEHDNGVPDYLRLETQYITPTCRENRGQNGAWEEAVARLREIYVAQSNHLPGVHLALTISRGPVDAVIAETVELLKIERADS